MSSIYFGNKEIHFEIKPGKNRKRTVAIQISPTLSVIVLTPYYLDEAKVKKIVEKKAAWITKKQEQIKKNQELSPQKEFVSGESFPYLGKYYRLKISTSFAKHPESCRLVNGRFCLEIKNGSDGQGKKAAIKKALFDWYLKRAEIKINERVKHLSPQVGKWPLSIKIKNQEKRWGSCSRTGVICFNWKIVMLPISVMDYIITHELCHLMYPHHSGQFWQKVQSVIPDYKIKRNWLKIHSHVTGIL